MLRPVETFGPKAIGCFLAVVVLTLFFNDVHSHPGMKRENLEKAIQAYPTWIAKAWHPPDNVYVCKFLGKNCSIPFQRHPLVAVFGPFVWTFLGRPLLMCIRLVEMFGCALMYLTTACLYGFHKIFFC